ncbi:MAG: metallophosphoesterase [Firmicutes bacterium HGW-Firmicutes-14]|nr:MAG: metallophosphoesterase [Firmicutes bacterium HGW-Firmicutes-14]
MNRFAVVLIAAVFFFIYAGINYYIGLRGWQSLGGLVPWMGKKVYWAAFWALALSYLAGRLAERFLPAGVAYWMTLVGAYWLAAMFYFLLIIFALDSVRICIYVIGKVTGSVPGGFYNNPKLAAAAGLAVLITVAGIILYGTWNARNPVVTRYEISVPKQAGVLKQLHIVMISDSHLGEIIHNGRLNHMVEIINSLQPDIVLMPGDVIDENIGPFVEQRMIDTFRKLNPPYGIYSVPGNHEYIGGHIDEAIHYLEEAGVKVLRDRRVKVADSFYVIGRDDRAGERFTGRKRRALSELMEGIDRNLPVILLDHQPVNLDEPAQLGIDLQLSGHTHRGQLFPNHLITGRIYENDWGLITRGTLNVVVSSGVGTWGPPIRVGNKPEVVEIVIHFKG